MTTTATPDLSAGVRPVDAWRLIEAVDPGTVARWQQAQETFDREEQPWQARAAEWRRRAGSMSRRPESRFGRELRQAREAVVAAVEGLLASEGGCRPGGRRKRDSFGQSRPIPKPPRGPQRVERKPGP